VHGYDMIDDAITWDVLEHKLPILRADIARILAQPTIE
ncbi:MAG: hypothetical protein JWM57_4261, partial [Phycisphaerales bacterium]|nr:hypothetical protein [Phycisphaerales bacterium]